MTNPDLKEIDFKEMQEVGLSLLMIGTMYTYLTHLVLTPGVSESTEVYDCIKKSIKEMILEFDQDFYVEIIDDKQRAYNLGPKISEMIADYYEWKDIFREMGWTLEDDEETDD